MKSPRQPLHEESSEENSSTLYLKLFFLLVLGIFVFSIIYKGIILYKSHSFTGYSFFVLVLGKNTSLMYLNSSTDVLSQLTITNPTNLSQNPLHDSLMLGVPVQSVIKTNAASSLTSFSFIVHLLTNPSSYHTINMNLFDSLKFYSLSHEVPNTNIFKENLDEKNVPDTIDDTLYSLFKDGNIINEKASIEVINATDVTGLGARFSRILQNSGFNIVSVTSQDEEKKSQIIYRVDKSSYAYQVLSKILPFQAHFSQESSISDITIVLGDDIKKSL